MADIVIRDPDGGTHRFAAGTPTETINSEMERRWAERGQPTTPQAQPLTTPGQMPPGTRAGNMQPQPSAPPTSMVPLSADAERAQRIMLMGAVGGDRAGVTGGYDLLKTDPTFIAREHQAKKMGDLAAEQASRQSAGEAILPGVDALRYMIKQATDDDWKGAAGPYNTTKMPPRSEVPMSWGSWNAPEMTPTQARASFGYYANDPAYQKQWALQNNLEHLTGALTDQYVAAAGKGIAGSDARMELFRDLMRAAAKAPSREKAHEILDTAENSIRDMFRLPARVRNDEEFKMLPSGREFVGPDGQLRRKP